MTQEAIKPGSKILTSGNKKQRQANRIRLFLGLVVVLGLLISGHPLAGILLLMTLYLLQELFWSDHIFYDPAQAYCYNFDADHLETITLHNNIIYWNKTYQQRTLLLEINIQASISGYVTDPYIDIMAGNRQQRQYFERRLNGIRYLNLSHINEPDFSDDIVLRFHGCKPKDINNRLYSFEKPVLSDKKILVIAPHADDAELAAFGIYSQNDSFIATLTAGETEADYYEDMTTTPDAAARLKGSLRAWDSIAVPQWAGLDSQHSIQLGYFCLTLEQMQQQPEKVIASTNANLSDPRYFRQFNSFALASDASGSSTWTSLVNDLGELLEMFRPDIIISPHPVYDPHKDHYYATLAAYEACQYVDEKHQFQPECFLLYANHYQHTDMFPFGQSGSLAALAPEFEQRDFTDRIVSFAVTPEKQQQKMAALAMMHDLIVPISIKKKIRQQLQQWLLGRERFIYGNDDYFRKAIRANEVFFVADMSQLKQITVRQ